MPHITFMNMVTARNGKDGDNGDHCYDHYFQYYNLSAPGEGDGDDDNDDDDDSGYDYAPAA
ncbi:hypothetical protein L484_025626 [Morus notabilis]|uniref:Uncharacterized protein n=1 Tax=Morus notabilis TaxID=981085 RepID=W9R8S0_9ROSA|nr:hypothetical protein L484_025626 [Morus notabilis]